MHQLTAQILTNKKAGPYMLMKLTAPELARDVQPGQFVMLQVAQPPDPLLRRPFGIPDIWFKKENMSKPEGIFILYQKVGRGTELMSDMQAGEYVNVIGPLGKGFSECKTTAAVVVVGGIGVVIFKLLAKRLKAKGAKITLLAGARTKDRLYTEGASDADRIVLTTDDGSKGIKGPVTAALEAVLKEDADDVTIYAAGPTPMLQTVAELAAKHETPCELSLEARMACGIGACCGCVVKAADENGTPGYLRVCKDGPVFNSRRILEF